MATSTDHRPSRRGGVRASATALVGVADELLGEDGSPRPLAAPLWAEIERLGARGLAERQAVAEGVLAGTGVTFPLASDLTGADGEDGLERLWPVDVVPRLVARAEWEQVAAGVVQRLRALNAFVDDCYHDQQAIRAGIVPVELVTESPHFRPECVGVDPPGGVWAHICGGDLVRDASGRLVVLEDNLRVPSGAAYMVENRVIAKQVLPEAFRSYSVEPVDPYLDRLAELLVSVAPGGDPPVVVVLTPGSYNAAYFEHAFLAHHIGAELVEAADLVVSADDRLWMRTVGGLRQVHVVYRRVDDLFLDPEVLRRDSLVGVPGLLRAWRAGTVALVNAPGAGIADDKALYGYVPELVRFYLGEEPTLGDVPTWWCGQPEDCRYVLAHLAELVVKPVGDSGGYGVVIGPDVGRDALDQVAKRIERHPRGWVAQPVVELSTAPTWSGRGLERRFVDLRPFGLLGPDLAYVSQGGLTRVAARSGSRIVNSSQGGSSKDTWVVTEVLHRRPGGANGLPAGVSPAAPVAPADLAQQAGWVRRPAGGGDIGGNRWEGALQ
jgi:uncharacterized circularly permuted ATP-grasp superfamily protein